MERDPSEAPILLFDGVCNLCHAAVRFVLAHERAETIRFASLQSGFARRLLEAEGRALPQPGEAPASMIFVEAGRLYEASDAALQVARHLRAPYRLLAWARLVPRPIRDAVYRFVARHRYRWFGTRDACLLPTDALRDRLRDEP